jgi:hypothetical protein
MSSPDKFRDYAADCVRKAGEAATAEDKTLLLNMGLAWMRLAQQVESVAAMTGEAQDLRLAAADDPAGAVADAERV